MTFDIWTAVAALLAMTLIVTLKLSLTGRLGIAAGSKPPLIFHPVWLAPLVVLVPYVCGAYVAGKMSPWPPTAFEVAAEHGLWAGVCAALAAVIIDLWLFWTTAAALICFTHPLATIYEPIPKQMHKFYYLVNLLVGAVVVYKAVTAGG